MKLGRVVAGGLVGTAMLAFGGTADAAVINQWTNINNNSSFDVGGQLAVEITDAGSDRVTFRFTNDVGIASSVARVYFDDKDIAVLALPHHSLVGSAGVSFSSPANPDNLPGGNTISFEADYSAGADAPPPQNGINAAGEWLDITFNLAVGVTFQDVLDQIASGELVIGMHVIALPDDKSDAYYNTPTTVPEPASLALLGMGLLGLGFAARRRRAH